MPELHWQPCEDLINDVDDVTVISTNHFITSNHARNLVVEQSDTEFLCLVENDVYVEPGWLSRMINACQDLRVDVAEPLILEPAADCQKVHFDERLGSIEKSEGAAKWKIVAREDSKENDRTSARKIVQFIEMHCCLFRKSVFDHIGPFDPSQRGSRAEVDLSMALHAAGIEIVLEPKSIVTFHPPPPIYPEERNYFRYYWDVGASIQDHKSIEERWDLEQCPSSIGFVENRMKMSDEQDPERQIARHEKSLHAIRQVRVEVEKAIPKGATFILVDDEQWKKSDVSQQNVIVPFLEKDGEYWGTPEHDETAIGELSRLIAQKKATHIVFGQPAFWWFDYYKEFHKHLRETARIVVDNDNMVIFDLGNERH